MNNPWITMASPVRTWVSENAATLTTKAKKRYDSDLKTPRKTVEEI